MVRPDRRAVLLAVGASLGVVAAEVFGVLTTGVAVGLMAAAVALAALSVRANRPYRQPHVLGPLPQSGSEVVIAAAKASQLAQGAQTHTDAA